MIVMNYKKKYVETYDGKTVEKSKCRKFLVNKVPKYYEIGVSCFKLNRPYSEQVSYVRIDSGLLSYDVAEKTWNYTSMLQNKPNYTLGYYNKQKDLGYFYYDIRNSVWLKDHVHDHGKACITKDLALELGYDEFNYDGCYYNRSTLAKLHFDHLKSSRISKDEIVFRDTAIYQATNSKFYNAVKSPLFKLALDNYLKADLEITKEDTIISEFLPFSLGYEFETKAGKIPERYIYDLGVLPLKDGSISGYEYTTIPLYGNKGISSVRQLLKELKDRCTQNYACSFHIHFGGLPYNKLMTSAIYKLGFLLQDEIFQLFPMYKHDPGLVGAEKNYCKKLKPYTLFEAKEDYEHENFNTIYKYLCTNDTKLNKLAPIELTKKDNIKKLSQVNDPTGNQKWNCPSRYVWLNLNPFLFGPNTIEFRLHTPTFNQTKVFSWLLICSAILKYAEQNCVKLAKATPTFKVSLEDVIKEGLGIFQSELKEDLIAYILSYIKFRKEEMAKYAGVEQWYGREIETDGDFTFSCGNSFDEVINNKELLKLKAEINAVTK